jgi:HAD superfamily hydrolase (TIGR01484 family)
MNLDARSKARVTKRLLGMATRYHALACDYDGTLALHGQVDQPTVVALEKCRQSGRKLLLVTGRELDELLGIFPRADLFEFIVAENGALLYEPATRNVTPLADRAPEQLVRKLKEHGVAPMSVGHTVIATWRPHETTVLECIRDMGLEIQVIFNKDAVMALPSGVNKASGLEAALKKLGLSHHNVVAVGDAENDHAFLSACEFGCAVANALPALKEHADLVTDGDHGRGVAELIECLVADDLARYADRQVRHFVLLGSGTDGPIAVDPYHTSILLAGSSGSGKSGLATGFLERLVEHSYQFCIIDPEGDYQNLQEAVVLGDNSHAPSPDEVMDLLADPGKNAVVNLLGLALEHRPPFFEQFYPRLLELRASTGHPHWTILDEAHHLLPGSWQRDNSMLRDLRGVLFITVHPEHIPGSLLAGINTVLITGREPQSALSGFAARIGAPSPVLDGDLGTGECFIWRWQAADAPLKFQVAPHRTERRRHHRKYAEGELGPESSFYFRGPDGKLNLRAQNLILFLQIAEGVDDQTWNYHLRRGDYSGWFREAIKDDALAAEAAAIEHVPTGDTRSRIREAIERRYTLPA